MRAARGEFGKVNRYRRWPLAGAGGMLYTVAAASCTAQERLRDTEETGVKPDSEGNQNDCFQPGSVVIVGDSIAQLSASLYQQWAKGHARWTIGVSRLRFALEDNVGLRRVDRAVQGAFSRRTECARVLWKVLEC